MQELNRSHGDTANTQDPLGPTLTITLLQRKEEQRGMFTAQRSDASVNMDPKEEPTVFIF